MYRLLKFGLSWFLLVGSVLAQETPPRDFPVEPNTSDGVLVLNPGMILHQDVTTACLSGTSSCTFSECSTSANCMFPTVSGSALIVAALLPTSAHITSAYLCNSSSGCNSNNATASFSLCPDIDDGTSRRACAIYNSTLGYGNDLAYLLSGPSGNSFLTVNVSATQTSGWVFNVIEVEPPSGYSFSALDSAGTTSNSTCTKCTMGAPRLTATDLVFQFNDFNGTALTGPFFSSPYITDGFANGLCFDCTTSRAPTMTQGGAGGTVVSWIALKTTAGRYSTARTMSIAAHLLPGSGSAISCSPNCPNITVPSTTSGDLLRIYAADDADGSAPHISKVSGCGTWVVPASCRNAVAGPNLYQSCAYNLSATSNCTGPIKVTMSGSGTNVVLDYWEIHQTRGSWTRDTSGCTHNAPGNNLPTGEALTLNDKTHPHAIFQTILDSGGVSGVTFYPWTTNGGSPTLYNGTIAYSEYFASDMLRLDTTDATAPTWAYPDPSPAATGVCADAYYHD